jgi:ribosomal protein L32
MRAKCPKCGEVFELPWQPTVVHLGPVKLIKCPACGKRSMMNTMSKEPVTWPKEEGSEQKESTENLTEEEKLARRIRESKYE